MRCHYEVLELDRVSCTADDIKRQYRRMALKWHPDKNHGQEEIAEANFKDVAAAYAVLSDAREKKWYDDHREAILRGSNGTRGNQDDDGEDCMDLWGYFSESCYTAMDDSESGFYRIYRDAFEQLIQQENASATKLVDYPSFGDSTLGRAEVIEFYNQWSNFVSVLTFSWEDEYNATEAPDRRVRREIEKINKKARDAGRKKYVDQVHQLVSYVRKRDPRMVVIEEAKEAKKAEEKARKEAARAEELEKRAQGREKRLALLNSEEEIARREAELEGAYLLADHSSSEDDDAWGEIGGRVRRRRKKRGKGSATAGASGGDYDSDELAEMLHKMEQMQPGVVSSKRAPIEATDESEAAEFTCELCDKTFKEAKQLQQHLNSKPHRQAAKEASKKSKKTGAAPTIKSNTVASSFKSTATEEDVEDSVTRTAEPEKEIRQKHDKKKSFQLRGKKGQAQPGSGDEAIETIFRS